MFKLILKITCFLCLCVCGSCLHNPCPGRLITNLHQKNCTDRATDTQSYYLNNTGCIPNCVDYKSEITTGLKCDDDPTVCTAGYTCQKRCGPKSEFQSKTCEITSDCSEFPRGSCTKFCHPMKVDVDVDSPAICMAYHSNIPDYADKWWTAQKFKPVCDDDGNWEPKQCKGGLQGRCMCFSSTGVRLFGEALYTESEKMTCACSRKKDELESAGRNYASLHCDSMGNYENLQCDQEKGLCWCVESQTGELTAPMVPSVAMKKLPCYNVDKVGSQYLRQCESKKFATAMINAKLKTHGVVTVATDSLLCNADGGYGAYTVSSGMAYCTWRDNTRFDTFFVQLQDMKDTLTCNCARDRYRYGQTQSCESNGNYVILQKSTNGKSYCVDNDGFAKTDLIDSATANCSKYY